MVPVTPRNLSLYVENNVMHLTNRLPPSNIPYFPL